MTEKINPPVVLAAAAHPDDIEFMMAGTMLRLKNAGAQIHMWNLANGCCGSAKHTKEKIVRLRRSEARAAARIAGAVWRAPLVDDFALMYEPGLLAQIAAAVREIKPDLMLVPSPDDYMEDHQNACRLLVTAAFVRGMPNFTTSPSRPPWSGEIVIYHASPYGLHDQLRRLVRPDQYVDISAVLADKRAMLGQHKTQKEWLDESQGIDAYLMDMEKMSRQVGRMSGRFKYAEGWRRHNHLGFAPQDRDSLSELLGDACWVDHLGKKPRS